MTNKALKNILQIIVYLLLSKDGVTQPVKTSTQDTGRVAVKALRTWTMPEALKDISGISYVDADRIACIQDKVGIVYIYNIATSFVESTISFAPPGDYEGIEIVKDNMYVICADGRIYEIIGYKSAKPQVKEYGTHLTVKQNVEGVCYDKKKHRLLVVIKGQEEGDPLFKGIYEFDLATKAMTVKPVMKIDLQDPIFGKSQAKKNATIFQPSEMAIHPLTGEIYILEAVRSLLLIMDPLGKIKAHYALDKSVFNHPEGMLFTPSGDLYIANEGKRQLPGTIVQAQLVK